MKNADHKNTDLRLVETRRLIRLETYLMPTNPRPIHELKVKVKLLSRVRLFETPWTVDYQASLSMEFSRQEYWSGLPFPSAQLQLSFIWGTNYNTLLRRDSGPTPKERSQCVLASSFYKFCLNRCSGNLNRGSLTQASEAE